MITVQFSNKRVGSTFLQKTFNSHPDLVGIDEVFVNICRKARYRKSGYIPYIRPENPFKTPKEYIKNLVNTNKDKKIIMKLMYNQISFHAGLHNLINNKKFPIIHLKRKNIIKQFISGKKAAFQNHDPISISGDQLLKEVTQLNTENEWWTNYFKVSSHKYIELFYEDLFGMVEEKHTFIEKSINNRLCDFLEVKRIPMYADTKKKNKDDIWIYLRNKDDVMSKFKNTKFEWMVK